MSACVLSLYSTIMYRHLFSAFDLADLGRDKMAAIMQTTLYFLL